MIEVLDKTYYTDLKGVQKREITKIEEKEDSIRIHMKWKEYSGGREIGTFEASMDFEDFKESTLFYTDEEKAEEVVKKMRENVGERNRESYLCEIECSHCENKLIDYVYSEKESAGQAFYDCPKCKEEFYLTNTDDNNYEILRKEFY